MNVHPFGNVDDKLNIGIIIIIGASRHLNILVGHANVVRICLQIFGSCHHCKLDRSLVPKGFVGPFPYGPDFLDGGDTIVGNEYLPKVRNPPIASLLNALHTTSAHLPN